MNRTSILFLFSAISLVGCKDKKGGGGQDQCEFATDCGIGFVCNAGMCLPDGGITSTTSTTSTTGTTDTTGATDATSATGATTGGATTGDASDSKGGTGGDSDCVGELYCPCAEDGYCDIDLDCHPNGICVPDTCPDGDVGCECKDGMFCGIGLDCLNGTCVDLSEPECVQPDDPCFDNVAGSLGDCCAGTLCIGIESDNNWRCSSQCTVHSECITDCCVPVANNEQTYCSPSFAFCQDNGKCIDTCPYADDGDCDDGGPGSDFGLCELGTDCADCGARF